MDSVQLIKRLESEGWVRVGGKGDHMKFKHPNKQGHMVVPHPRKDMLTGTLRNIYRQASNQVVFKIKGNDYRLLVVVRYTSTTMFIRFVGTHESADHDPV